MHPTTVIPMIPLAAFLLVLLTSSVSMAEDLTTTQVTTLPSLESTTVTDSMLMMSDESDASPAAASSKSAQLNLPSVPGLGGLDLASLLKNLPGFSAPSLPTLPNLTLPSVPSLPKLFSEVPCVSLVSARAGVCRKEDACRASTGLPDGPCALSLGVCCTKPFTCGQTIIGNESLITSPGYPEPSTKSDLCTITILKGLEVAQIRLDLEVFDIAGADSAGVCSEDVMEITGANADVTIPKICGMNQGQHLYIPVDKTAALSPLVIKFILSKTSTAHRVFRIKVTQLKKDHPDLAPAGCMQYHTGKEGVVRSFNYEHVKNVGIRTIKGVKYGVCFRKEKEHCKVKLNPTYTRVVRSAVQTPARPAYYYPAARPAVVYHHKQQQYSPVVLSRRPVYLSYPVPRGYYQHARGPIVYQQRPQVQYQHQRPVVYYPVPVMKNYYYKPVEEKKEDKVKDLVEKKTDLIKDLVDKKVDLVNSLLEKKVELLNEKVEKKVEYPVHAYGQNNNYGNNKGYYYPGEKKVEIVDKKKEEIDGLLAKKKLLIEELSSLLKLSGLPTIELPKLPTLPTLPPFPTLSSSLILPTVPSMISKDAYGLIVDNDHEELERGFSIAYKEECTE